MLADEYFRVMNQRSRVLRMNTWYAFPALQSTNAFDPNGALIKLISDSREVLESIRCFTIFSPIEKSFSVRREKMR